VSEKNSSKPDAVKNIVDTVVAVGKEATGYALSASKEVAESTIDRGGAGLSLGKEATKHYIDSTLGQVRKSTKKIKEIGNKVPLLPEEFKEKIFGEPSLGDRPKDAE